MPRELGQRYVLETCVDQRSREHRRNQRAPRLNLLADMLQFLRDTGIVEDREARGHRAGLRANPGRHSPAQLRTGARQPGTTILWLSDAPIGIRTVSPLTVLSPHGCFVSPITATRRRHEELALM